MDCRPPSLKIHELIQLHVDNQKANTLAANPETIETPNTNMGSGTITIYPGNGRVENY